MAASLEGSTKTLRDKALQGKDDAVANITIRLASIAVLEKERSDELQNKKDVEKEIERQRDEFDIEDKDGVFQKKDLCFKKEEHKKAFDELTNRKHSLDSKTKYQGETLE